MQETVMSRILMAVKEKVVNVCQQGSDNSLRSVVDAVLAKLDTVSSTDVNNDTQVLVVGVNLKVCVDHRKRSARLLLPNVRPMSDNLWRAQKILTERIFYSAWVGTTGRSRGSDVC